MFTEKIDEHHIRKINGYYEVFFKRQDVKSTFKTLEDALEYRDRIWETIVKESITKVKIVDARKYYPLNVIDMIYNKLKPLELKNIDRVWVDDNAKANVDYVIGRIANSNIDIFMEYVNGKTGAQIAEERGFTRQYVSLVVQDILEKILQYRDYILYPSEFIEYEDKIAEYTAKNAELDEKIKMLDEQLKHIKDEHPALFVSIKSLGLKRRTYNSLIRNEINWCEQLCDMTEEELMQIRSLGVAGLEDIKQKLNEKGYKLRG